MVEVNLEGIAMECLYSSRVLSVVCVCEQIQYVCTFLKEYFHSDIENSHLYLTYLFTHWSAISEAYTQPCEREFAIKVIPPTVFTCWLRHILPVQLQVLPMLTNRPADLAASFLKGEMRCESTHSPAVRAQWVLSTGKRTRTFDVK